MKLYRYIYNPLNQIFRKVIYKVRQLRKDVMLIVMGVVITAFGTLVPSMVIKTNWSVVNIVWYSIVMASLLFIMWTLAKGVKAIYDKEDLDRKAETKQLINDTVNNTVDKTLRELGLKK